MKYKVAHVTTYEYSETVSLCHNEVHLTPRELIGQTCTAHRVSVKPTPSCLEHTRDYFGNHNQFFTIQEGHRKLMVTAVSKVELLPPPSLSADHAPAWTTVRELLRQRGTPLHLDPLNFLYESEQIPLLPELATYAELSFPPGRDWLTAHFDLMARIHHDFTYDPMATTVSTPLADVLRLKRGVCQDFAHLMIGCLRSIGLSARYVSGYLLTHPPAGQTKLVGADASHAWISSWCPQFGWVDFDPTNNCRPQLEHITLAWGREYSDVCPIKGVFLGGGRHHMNVSVDVLPID